MRLSLVIGLSFLERVAAQGTNLNGGIVTRTDVSEYADLALDLRDIQSYSKQESNRERIRTLYMTGYYSQITPGALFPLQKLSDDFANNKADSPFYTFHVYGLSDGATSLSSLKSQFYASTFIQQTINTNLTLVADSIIALSCWMYSTYLLYNGVVSCERRTMADEPSLIKLGGGGIDEFIAMWIGADQAPASIMGHGLYAWTQRVGDLFGTNSPEAAVNSAIKVLYQLGATTLSIGDACTKSNTQTVADLWTIGVQITNAMMVPLFQWLIYSLIQQDPVSTRLYATALVPQISRCRPSLFQRLKDNLLGSLIDFGKTDDILADLQASYSCFSLTCDDIGSYQSDPRLDCDASIIPSLAGFAPSTDVSSLSRIDLDIYQLRLLAELESFVFARYQYLYGRNVQKPRSSDNDPFELLSLNALAVAATRLKANPMYSQFVSFFNDKDYANNFVSNTLQGSSRWTVAAQRSVVIAMTCAFQIVFLQTIGQLQNAVLACQAADPQVGFISDRNPLDEAAAFLIGSMEGEAQGGSPNLEDGQLIWNLADQRAFQFNRLNSYGYASVNTEIVDLLYAGKGELDVVDCDRLAITTQRIQGLMLVGLMQSLLRAATLTQKSSPASTDPITAEAEVLANSTLPIIASVNNTAAQLVQSNMVGKNVVTHSTSAATLVLIGDAIGASFQKASGVNCYYLGYTADVNPCRLLPNSGTGNPTDSSSSWRVNSSWAFVIIILSLGAL